MIFGLNKNTIQSSQELGHVACYSFIPSFQCSFNEYTFLSSGLCAVTCVGIFQLVCELCITS